MGEIIEKEFGGKKRASVWTYLILAVLLIAGAVVVNLVVKNPETARETVNRVIGLPHWALATIALVVGAFIYWIGLKVETDWPEYIGAFIIAGAVTAFEFIIGWEKLEFGLVVIPYVIPLLVFVVLIIVAMKKSA
jgi:hypothetical protein